MKKKYWRKIYDLDGVWIAMERRELMTIEQAKKLGYKPPPPLQDSPTPNPL